MFQQTYPLYQTLHGKTPKNNLTKVQQAKFVTMLESLTAEQKNAFVHLIIQHASVTDAHYAKLVEQYMSDPGSNPVPVPYKGIVQEEGVDFVLKHIPLELRWILWKFLNVCSNGEK